MKYNNLFLWLLGLTVCWLVSCSEEDDRGTYPYSCPEITADTESDNQTRSDAPGDSISVLFLCRMSRNLHPQFLDPLFVISLHLLPIPFTFL